MDENYTVYMHIFPNNKKYIGITKQIPKYRWRNKNFHYNKNMVDAIYEFGWNNIEHKILYEHLTKEEAEQKEIELIAQYKSNQREFGYNLYSGGTKGFKRNQETLNKLSSSLKGRKSPCGMLGKKHSMETKLKMSETRKGKKRKITSILKTAEANSIKVNQYDLNGNYIRSWNSISNAARELKIKDSDISRVCKGKRNKCGGYIWKYASEVISDGVKI